MRTTMDLDPSVLKELRRRSRGAGKSMGKLASELLARSLHEDEGKEPSALELTWISGNLGQPRVDLEDKEALRAVIEDSSS
jgi:hypothetical protein